MSRYIDADALLEKVYTIVQTCDGYETIESVVYADQIEDAPTVDSVPVVRCKNCIHSRPDEYGLECMAHYRPTKEDDFCSYGEKVTE